MTLEILLDNIIYLATFVAAVVLVYYSVKLGKEMMDGKVSNGTVFGMVLSFLALIAIAVTASQSMLSDNGILRQIGELILSLGSRRIRP